MPNCGEPEPLSEDGDLAWDGTAMTNLCLGNVVMPSSLCSVSLGSSAVFRWRRQSCSDDEGHLCWLGHGDILVMDGQCQDEFLHRTDPGREQERINLTFRWVKQHVSSCPLCEGRSGMLFANVCARLFFSCYGRLLCLVLHFSAFLVSSWCLVHMGSFGFAELPVVYKTWVT